MTRLGSKICWDHSPSAGCWLHWGDSKVVEKDNVPMCWTNCAIKSISGSRSEDRAACPLVFGTS